MSKNKKFNGRKTVKWFAGGIDQRQGDRFMLNNKEQQVLNIIQSFQAENGYSPTFSDIAEALNLKSKATVSYYIKALKEKGYIHIPKGKRKHIEIIDQTDNGQHNLLHLPLVGTIAAGLPLEAYEVIETIDLSELLNMPDRYLLKISGNSMQESGILDGDLVLIQKQHIARNGQIVVALIDEKEATLKEFKMQDNKTVTLIPHNEDLPPMIYPAHRVSIQGVYLGMRLDRSFLL